MKNTPQKWRPSLSMVVVGMLIFILSLPIAGIWLFRFYDNHLVRETEKELIVQAAFIEAIITEEVKTSPPPSDLMNALEAIPQNPKKNTSRYIKPQLDLATSLVLPPRPDVNAVQAFPIPFFLALGRKLDPILERSQGITLAGYRVLDSNGVIIAGRSNVGKSLGHISEIEKALTGKYASVIRERISDSPSPPIYSISRGTDIRVFVAMPVLYENRVLAVIYLSRTPSHFLRELYDQKLKIGLAVLFMLTLTIIIAFIFIRTIKGPIEALNKRTQRIADGDRSAIAPLTHHGTRELASLSQGLMAMSHKLSERSDYLKTFATHVSHELKSPLTSIQGAAELLRDANDQMNEAERIKFLGNILSDTQRLEVLVDRLRALAIADNSDHRGSCNLHQELSTLKARFKNLDISIDDTLNHTVSLTPESVDIIFGNLFDNAHQHQATQVALSAEKQGETLQISVQDNGEGVSELNRAKIFDLFYTTRREEGGTGMGLGIVQSILSSNGGSIEYLSSHSGACFLVTVECAKL